MLLLHCMIRFFQDRHRIYEGDAQKDGAELHKCLCKRGFFMQLRNQVAARNIEKISRNDRKENIFDTRDIFTQYQHGNRAKKCRERREKIPYERTTATETAVYQYGKVPDLLWNFVQNNRYRRGDPEFHIHKIRRGNENPVRDVVCAVPDEHHRPHGMMISTIKIVTMMPMNKFFENK